MNKWAFITLSFIVGLIIIPAAAYLYFAFGNLPVAVADAPFPFEAKIVRVPLHARIDREMPSQSPLAMNDENLIAGAQTYHQQCASCHGSKNHLSSFAANMFPRAPQLWSSHRKGMVGVSDDLVGETFWKVKNGIRLSGMPAYKSLLSDEQIWQVSMLLSVADKPVPQKAVDLLNRPLQ